MFWLIIWLIILILFLAFQAFHGFLPNKIQCKKWIRITAIIIAIIMLSRSVFQEIAEVRNRSSAYVSPDAKIIESYKFPWKISRSTTSDDNLPVYIIEERYGDASEVKVKPDRHVRFKVYNAIDGVAVKFFCESDDVPSFKVEISP
jgi:hypothetical protein